MSPSSSTGSSEAALRRPLLNSGLVAQFPALLSSCTGTRPARGCLPCEAPWPHTCYDCWRTASGHLLLGAETRGVEGSRGWPAILSRKRKKGDWSNPSWPDLRSENPKTQQVFQWKLKIFSCWLYTPWPQCCSNKTAKHSLNTRFLFLSSCRCPRHWTLVLGRTNLVSF